MSWLAGCPSVFISVIALLDLTASMRVYNDVSRSGREVVEVGIQLDREPDVVAVATPKLQNVLVCSYVASP